MKSSLIHIIPFDIGYSFIDINPKKDQTKADFIEKLRQNSSGKDISLEEGNGNLICTASLSAGVKCYLLEWGIGVFVIRGLPLEDTSEISEYFQDSAAPVLYYQKKREQHKILNQSYPALKILPIFLQIIWASVNTKTRAFSSSVQYKHLGFSYVMTLYHLTKYNGSHSDDRDIELLMNPDLLGRIADPGEWASIHDRLNGYCTKSYARLEFGSQTFIGSSWSAVAVVENTPTAALDKMIAYEITLQAGWFLFDCLIDNIKKKEMSHLDLQKEKSLATNVSLDITNIMSANMSTGEKRTMESIYETSGFSILKDKLFLLLENRISISDAKIKERQGLYGIITEILLIVFTLVSIYEPVKNLINGTIDTSDYIVGGIMLIALIICSVFIVRKER